MARNLARSRPNDLTHPADPGKVRRRDTKGKRRREEEQMRERQRRKYGGRRREQEKGGRETQQGESRGERIKRNIQRERRQ